MKHIFLSYSRVDSTLMQQVKSDFEAEGIQVWTDQGIEPGTPLWKDAIEEAIEKAGCLVVILSPDSKESIWVKRELDYASVQDIPIFALLGRGDERDAVPFALVGSQYVDIREQYSTGIQQLLPVLKQLIEIEDRTPPPTKTPVTDSKPEDSAPASAPQPAQQPVSVTPTPTRKVLTGWWPIVVAIGGLFGIVVVVVIVVIQGVETPPLTVTPVSTLLDATSTTTENPTASATTQGLVTTPVIQSEPGFISDGFDSPVGSDTERRGNQIWPGNWIDASPFGRLHFVGTPIESYHTGADLNLPADADRGKPVYAPASGVVINQSRYPTWGELLVIRHDPLFSEDGQIVYSRYQNLESISVKVGDRVERGQEMGIIGNNDGQNAFYLHFDLSPTSILETNPGHWPGDNLVSVQENYVDPKGFIEQNRPPIAIAKPTNVGSGQAAIIDAPADFVNVRAGPNALYTDVGIIENKTQVVYYPRSRRNNWVWVERASVEGWVSEQVATFGDLAPTQRVQAATPYDGKSSVWFWEGDAINESSIDEFATNLKAQAPNIQAVIVKTSDGSNWQGNFDNSSMAINGPADIERWVEILGNYGLEFHAWAVAKGVDLEGETSLIIQAAQTPGVQSMILMVEPYDGFWEGDRATVQSFMTMIRDQVGDDFHIGIGVDPRVQHFSSIFPDEWRPFVNSIHPEVYWATFRRTPEEVLDEAYTTWGHYGLPIIPILQADSQTNDQERALTVATETYSAPGISWWRAGVISDFTVVNTALAANITGVNLDILHPQGHPSPDIIGNIGWVRISFNVSYNPANNSYGNQDIDAAYERYLPFIESYANAGKKIILVFDHRTYGEGAGYNWSQMTDERWQSDFAPQFADMVGRIAARFRANGLVDVYQIWNEQDAPTDSVASIPMSPENYAVLLAESIQAIRDVDANARIITGGHVSGPGSGVDYAESTLAAMPPSIQPDGVAFHPFGRGADIGSPYAPYGTLAESIAAFGELLPNRPVWITEWGVLNYTSDDPESVAEYASDFLNTLRQSYNGQIGAAIWSAWADDMLSGYGLVNSSGEPKEALFRVFAD